MSRAAASLLAFGAYLALGGLLLIFVPAQMCRLLAMAAPQGAWIRITGMLMLFLGFLCLRAAREEERSFMRWSLYTRSSTTLFLAWFVARGWIEPVVLVFGVIDLLAAAWTWAELRKDS